MINFLPQFRKMTFGVQQLLWIYERLAFGDGKVDSESLLRAIKLVSEGQFDLINFFTSKVIDDLSGDDELDS